ncbi:MAG TPA: LuxR C-terminal-related transcriptional regulator [Acidimicrobiia bacterium]
MGDAMAKQRASKHLPIASSKFGCPRVPDRAVTRPRLIKQLDDSDWRVTVVTGAPASGKTLAVAQWYRSLGGIDREWVTLSERDDQPGPFCLLLAAAANRARPGTCDRSEQLAARSTPDRRLVLDQLLEDLAESDEPIVLVFDDVHQIRDPAIWAELVTFLEALPDHVRVVLTSRTDPPIPRSAWKARLVLAEVRQRDLDFTLAETELLLGDLRDVELSDSDVEMLWTQTGGWAAALRLAANSIQQSSDPRRATREFSARNAMITDLLVTDVLDPQTEEDRRFLLLSSVLDELDADLCNAVTGRDDSTAVLRRLESELQFIVALDSDRTRYRCHPLLAEVLSGELERTMPGIKPKLYRVAGEFLEDVRRNVIGAVWCYLHAGDNDRAFVLISDMVYDRYDRGDTSSAAAWVELLPLGLVTQSPSHMLTYGMMLFFLGRVDEALAWAARAQRILDADPDAHTRERALLDAMMLLAFTTNGAAQGGIDSGRRAVAALERGYNLGFPGYRARPNLARAYLLADRPDDAEATLRGGPLGDEVAELLLGPAVYARIALRNGDLEIAEVRSKQALAAAAVLEMKTHPGVLDALLARGGVFADRGKSAQAEEIFEHLDRVTRPQSELVVYQVLGRCDRVRLLGARADYDRALDLIDEMRCLIAGRPRTGLATVIDCLAVRWLIEAGETDEARRLTARIPRHFASRWLLDARLSLAGRRPSLAIDALSEVEPTATRDRLTHHLFLARANLEAENADMTTVHLSNAIDVALVEGFALPFLEEGREVIRRARALADSRHTPAASHLAAALGAPPQMRIPSQPSTVMTEREAAVLRFLPTLLTNQEIAKECLMSVNTVKTHLKSIYSKLGVSSRPSAVAEARLQGLLK